MIRRWLLLFSVLVLAAACSGGGSKSESARSTTTTGSSSTVPAGTSGWVRSDLKPVTQPEPAGGVLVLYVQAGGGLIRLHLKAAR